jgi:3-methyladenine DNA glycosylase AlkD
MSPRKTSTEARGDPTALAAGIERELRAAGDPDRAVKEKAYLKSDLEFIGTGVPALRALARRVARERPPHGHDDVVALVEALWQPPVHERRMIAVEFLRLYASRLEANDIHLIERLIRESRTWALVDTLAEHVAGGLVEHHPRLATVLDRWATDEDLWVRRSAMLTLLGPLRRGTGDFARFARYAEAMLDEREFFIRKAIGWILRETSKKEPDRVSEWLEPRANRASGVTLREAVKYLSEEQRERILARAKETG